MRRHKLILFTSIFIFSLMFSACSNGTGPEIEESINGTWNNLANFEPNDAHLEYMVIHYPNLKLYITPENKECYIVEKYEMKRLSENKYKLDLIGTNESYKASFIVQDNILIVKGPEGDKNKYKSSNKEPATFTKCN